MAARCPTWVNRTRERRSSEAVTCAILAPAGPQRSRRRRLSMRTNSNRSTGGFKWWMISKTMSKQCQNTFWWDQHHFSMLLVWRSFWKTPGGSTQYFTMLFDESVLWSSWFGIGMSSLQDTSLSLQGREANMGIGVIASAECILWSSTVLFATQLRTTPPLWKYHSQQQKGLNAANELNVVAANLVLIWTSTASWMIAEHIQCPTKVDDNVDLTISLFGLHDLSA